MADDSDEKIDTSSPDVVNPLAGALEGLTIEEFITKATTPEPDAAGSKDEKGDQKSKEAAQSEGVKQGVQGVGQGDEAKEYSPSDDGDDISALLAIKPENLKTKGGAPPSESARQQFKTLQSALKAKDEKLKATIAQLEEAKTKVGPPLEENESYKTVLAEKEGLKKELEVLNFEHSDHWKETFITPIKNESERVATIVKGLKVPDDEAENFNTLLRRAESLFGDPESEIEFSNIVDKIAEDHMKQSVAQKFSRAMQSLFDLTVNRAKAYADKDKARQTILDSVAQKSNHAAKTLQERLDLELMAFEKTDVGQLYKKTPDFDFEASSKANRQKALQAVRDYAVTGQVTGDMAEMVRVHSLWPAVQKERDWLVANYLKAAKGAEALLKENEELVRRVASLRGEGKETVTQAKTTGNGTKENYGSAGWILGDEWEKTLNAVGGVR